MDGKIYLVGTWEGDFTNEFFAVGFVTTDREKAFAKSGEYAGGEVMVADDGASFIDWEQIKPKCGTTTKVLSVYVCETKIAPPNV